MKNERLLWLAIIFDLIISLFLGMYFHSVRNNSLIVSFKFGETAQKGDALYLSDGSTISVPAELYTTSFLNDPSLVSYYRLENNASDSVRNNNGQDYNVAYGSDYGRFGEGGSFSSASSSFIDAGASNNFQITGDFTISVWVYLRAFPKEDAKLVGKWNEAGGNRSYLLAIATTGQPYGDISSDGISVGNNNVWAPPLSKNVWHLITWTRSGGDEYLYVDGVQASHGPAADPYNSGTNSQLIIGGGGEEPVGGVSISLDASIDDVAIFNRALSSSEVNDLYNSIAIDNENSGLVYRASALSHAYADGFVGFAAARTLAGNVGPVIISGFVNVPMGLNAGKEYYVGNTSGTISLFPGTIVRKVGLAVDSSTLLITNIW